MTSAPKTPTPEYWQSVEEWTGSADFRALMKDEFPEDASEWLDPVSRRRFLAMAGASVALAGAIGCNPSLKPAPQKKIIPYVRQPDQILPNVPLFFATAMPQAHGVGLGLLVKSHEGRPVKCEGNPNHPGSLGGLEHQALAAPLTLYDPDRSRQVLQSGNPSTFDRALLALRDELAKRPKGAGVRVVTEPTTSPALAGVMDELLKRYPDAKWVQYEPVGRDAAFKAAEAAFDTGNAATKKFVNPVYDLTKADVVVALDADFLSGSNSVRHGHDWAARRKVSTVDAAHALEVKAGKHIHPKPEEVVAEATKGLNRLYAVEGALTVTGASADHRLPLRPSLVEGFARNLAAKLGVGGVTAVALPDGVTKWIDELAKDLQAHQGKAIVIPGDSQSPAVHLLAHAINEKIGAATGKVVTFVESPQVRPADRAAEFQALVADMKAGKVDLLLLSGVNPAYDAPADADFPKLMTELQVRKGVVVHHGLHVDESAIWPDGAGGHRHAAWHLPAAHFLEAWGDVRAFDGTISVIQPLIAPLYSGKSLLELLAGLLNLPAADAPSTAAATDGLTLVREAARKAAGDKVKPEEFDAYWQRSLRDGVLAGTAFTPVADLGAVNLAKLNDKEFTRPALSELEIQFLPDPVLHDGRQANNGWLQELPKPITNLTWDNAAMVSPRTAADKKVEQSFRWTAGERGRTETEMVSIKVGDRDLTVPVLIQPGMADDVVVLHLGFGRERGGKIAGLYAEAPHHIPGFNAYKLRTAAAAWSAPARLERINQTYILAIAGAHAAMESRRPVRHATKGQFAADPDFAQIPPSSAGEYEEVRALTPGTPENYELLKMPAKYGHHHDDDKDKKEEEHKAHDKRLEKLSLYMVNPIKVNGDEATKTYRRWAMTIDLGSCTGCGVCTLACVAENNTPVVGKDQVSRARAMHWIRIDRYYSIPGPAAMTDELGAFEVGPAARKERAKDSAAIRTHFQPVPCQQCEKAPCEVVCPVGATVHSADGLNDMAYNRCVGTRYCSNNCPYKVRRFNFLQYTDYTTDSLKLLNNPEVSVRTRGVMEKCTYCTQRIRNAEIEAEREWKGRTASPRTTDANGRPKILDGEVVPACQQACPTGCITFGDLNDPDSKVLKTKAEEHNYGLLAELNVMPRTSYLAAIRNPNPNMPQGA